MTTFLGQLTQLCIPHMEQQKYGRIVFCSRQVSFRLLLHTGIVNPPLITIQRCSRFVPFRSITPQCALTLFPLLGTGGVIGPHYASSKSALHGLLHWIAGRYAKDGIVRAV